MEEMEDCYYIPIIETAVNEDGTISCRVSTLRATLLNGWPGYPPHNTPPPPAPGSAAETSGAETHCSMYRPRYCAGDGQTWKESSEVNRDKCAKCTRKEILKEKAAGW